MGKSDQGLPSLASTAAMVEKLLRGWLMDGAISLLSAKDRETTLLLALLVAAPCTEVAMARAAVDAADRDEVADAARRAAAARWSIMVGCLLLLLLMKIKIECHYVDLRTRTCSRRGGQWRFLRRSRRWTFSESRSPPAHAQQLAKRSMVTTRDFSQALCAHSPNITY